MPDLVGVVIPAYIGALSSLAGVVVAIVALVTARRARADARTATAEAARTAARQDVTRDAVVELTQLAAQTATPAAAEQTVVAPSSRRRPRAPHETRERRPYWAPRTGAAKTAEPRQAPADDRATLDDLQRRFTDVLRRVREGG